MAIVLTDNTNYQNIANAIRNKNGSSDTYSPSQMATAINNIPSGGGPSPEDLTFTDNCEYLFYQGKWDWIIEKYNNKISFVDITYLANCFNGSQCEDLSELIINCKTNYGVSLQSCFSSCTAKQLPIISNVCPSSLSSMFYNANYIRNIPDDYFEDWDFSYSSTLFTNCSSVFSQCHSLRKIPSSFFYKIEEATPQSSTSSSASGIYSLNGYCYVLNEVVGVVLNPQWKATSNGFTNICKQNYRLKDFKFKLNQDNTPKIGLFKGQTLDLTDCVGWGKTEGYITNYNSGITSAKKVTDTTSYNLLKDDPDWYTLDVNYSRYNHDSAVNTINTLPDCSATGTNTIKFKGQAGALTDGGAINTLTDAEIAVATAKGWTVTYA